MNRYEIIMLLLCIMEVEHDDIAPMEVEEETPQRPRKKLTPEHLEKMNRGYQRPSGRPASHLRSARKNNDDSDVSDGESDVDEKQSKQATSKSPGFSDWFKRKDKKSDADADDAESPKSRTEAWVQDPLMSRDETLGFFSPDQPKPNLRQRHRYNSFQSGLDGDQYHRQH